MKDDPDFNIKFVGLMEMHPCLYDYTSADYSRRNMQDRAWEMISKEISETVEDCKERWKNLRACYTRHLKMLNRPCSSGGRPKKAYYLAEHLNFLLPFTKSRNQPQSSTPTPQSLVSSPETIQTKEEPDDNSNLDEELEDLRKVDLQAELSTHQMNPLNLLKLVFSEQQPQKRLKKTPSYPISMEEVNKTALEFLEAKRVANAEAAADDPDVAFFKSVLPDIREMNNDQKRRFKIGVLNLAGQILSEPQVSPVLSNFSSSSTTMNSFNYEQQ